MAVGADRWKARLRQLNSRDMRKRIGAAIYVAGDLLRVEAAISISEGAVSGKNHVPSKPGQPPKYDTGHLADSIETRETGELSCEVSANAQYAAALEVGTSKMAARPFMAPAAAKVRPKAERLVAEAVRRETRRKR